MIRDTTLRKWLSLAGVTLSDLRSLNGCKDKKIESCTGRNTHNIGETSHNKRHQSPLQPVTDRIVLNAKSAVSHFTFVTMQNRTLNIAPLVCLPYNAKHEGQNGA